MLPGVRARKHHEEFPAAVAGNGGRLARGFTDDRGGAAAPTRSSARCDPCGSGSIALGRDGVMWHESKETPTMWLESNCGRRLRISPAFWRISARAASLR